LALCFSLTGEGAVPEWVELVPAPNAEGFVVGLDGRRWKSDAAAVAASFRKPIAVDVNHSTHTAADAGGESPARGWVEQFEARNGAVWGRVEWTTAGADAVRNKDYRYLSPALAVNKAGDIVGIRSVGLVNDPNFDLALNQRTEDPDEETVMLEKLLAALGLQKDVTEEVALNAVTQLKGDLQTALNKRTDTPDLNLYVPRADFDAVKTRAETAETSIATNTRQALDAEADREVVAAMKAGKITPATKDFYIATCSSAGGLEKFRAFIAAAPVIVADDQHRNGKPESAAQGALTTAQVALCKRMGISEADYADSAKALAARSQPTHQGLTHDCSHC